MPPGAVLTVITVPVDAGDGRLDGRVAYHDPLPVLLEAARGCLQGDLDALLDKLPWHGTVEVQPLAHGARCGQQLIGSKGQGHPSVSMSNESLSTRRRPGWPVAGSCSGLTARTEGSVRRLRRAAGSDRSGTRRHPS